MSSTPPEERRQHFPARSEVPVSTGCRQPGPPGTAGWSRPPWGPWDRRSQAARMSREGTGTHPACSHCWVGPRRVWSEPPETRARNRGWPWAWGLTCPREGSRDLGQTSAPPAQAPAPSPPGLEAQSGTAGVKRAGTWGGQARLGPDATRTSCHLGRSLSEPVPSSMREDSRSVFLGSADGVATARGLKAGTGSVWVRSGRRCVTAPCTWASATETASPIGGQGVGPPALHLRQPNR